MDDTTLRNLLLELAPGETWEPRMLNLDIDGCEPLVVVQVVGDPGDAVCTMRPGMRATLVQLAPDLLREVIRLRGGGGR